MFRWLKALLVTLTLAALSLFATSCGSGGNAQVRVVNAIPDNNESLDVDINGTKDFTSVLFDTVNPTPLSAGPAQYATVPPGSDTIEAFTAGQTSDPVVNAASARLSASTQYTVLLGGFPGSSPQAYVIPDNNTATATGKVNVRIIDGSAVAGSNGIDVYIYQTGLGPPPTPQVSGLALGRSSAYLPMTFESSYAFEVFSHGNGSPQFTFFETFVAGEIMTLVIVDTPNGQAMSDIPIVLTDLE
ncbi:MAG: DUF4397 domain-containing protein [Terriglobales bacterium]|jgi:hypothetical protein